MHVFSSCQLKQAHYFWFGTALCGIERFKKLLSEQPTVIRRRILIHRLHKPKYHCTCCFSGLKTITPARIRAGSSLRDELIIDVAAAKYGDLVPIERYCEIARAEGLEGKLPQTLIDLTHHLGEFLAGALERVRKSLLTAPVLHADNTPPHA